MSSLAPMKGTDDTLTFTSVWDIGASGAHTKVSGIPCTGFASVARTAAGKYTITFARGQLPKNGTLVDLRLTEWPVADAGPKNLRPTKATYTAETDLTGPTVKYEAWSVGTTPAQIELVAGSQVSITAVFIKTK